MSHYSLSVPDLNTAITSNTPWWLYRAKAEDVDAAKQAVRALFNKNTHLDDTFTRTVPAADDLVWPFDAASVRAHVCQLDSSRYIHDQTGLQWPSACTDFSNTDTVYSFQKWLS